MLKTAAIQLNTGIDRTENMCVLAPLVAKAAADGAQLIVTPEMTNVLDRKARRMFQSGALGEDIAEIHQYAAMAKQYNITLVIGSAAILLDDSYGIGENGRRAANRQLVFAPDGQIAARYDKMHMFDVDLPTGESWKESNVYQAGDAPVTVDIPYTDEQKSLQTRLGLSICYDIRFPELYAQMALAGVQILTIPAAFTRPTGEAHWEVLLRARAIETGCFVIAHAQSGTHEDGRKTWGHSMIISPWGEILAMRKEDGAGIISATLDLNKVAEARQAIPNLQHRKSYK